MSADTKMVPLFSALVAAVEMNLCLSNIWDDKLIIIIIIICVDIDH